MQRVRLVETTTCSLTMLLAVNQKLLKSIYKSTRSRSSLSQVNQLISTQRESMVQIGQDYKAEKAIKSK